MNRQDRQTFAMQNRTFCEGDNLEYLLRMPDESVDLIATDPPFNKNKEFQGIGKAEGANFKDYWAWDDDEDVHPAYLAHVKQHWPALNEVIEAAYAAHSPSMAAFLAFMSVRLIEMHRILKPTGSLYLHCDPTANAYLRLMLDSIFGSGRFRNDIIWQRMSGTKSTANRFFSQHDTILYYAKSESSTWNRELEPLTTEEIEASWFRYKDPDGRRYKVNDLTSPDKQGGHEYEFLGAVRRWRYPIERMNQLLADGQIHHKSCTPGAGNSVAVRKRYLDEMKGRPLGSVWTDIKTLNRNNVERTGYPTQKPLALYKRMIIASTNEGDLVLDPFAGCATTCVASEQLKRHWIGIDLSPKAKGITVDRLNKEAGEGTFWHESVFLYTVKDLPPLKAGITAALTTPSLPERGRRSIPRGYKPEDVRPYLATREAAGTRRARYGESNMSCQGCGYTPPRLDYMDVDHIVAQAKDGPHAWHNFCLLCPPCNRRKAHRLSIDDLRAEIREEGLMQNEDVLMPMDDDAITKRDRVVRPLQ